MNTSQVSSSTQNWIRLLIYILAIACGAAQAFAQQASSMPSRLGAQVNRTGAAPRSALAPAASQNSPLYTFTFGVIDYPRSQIGAAYGINDSGRIVGGYNNTNVMELLADDGFELKGNNFSTVNYPGALATDVFGINKSGEIVGSFEDSSENVHGFKLKGGTYTQLDYPGATYTVAVGINSSGEISGLYEVSPTQLNSFVLSGSTYTAISAPGSNNTQAVGINKYGVVAGYYYDASFNSHGFTYDKGTFTTIDYGNGYPNTYLSGINDSGVIVGGYGSIMTLGSTDYYWEHGFLYSGGTFNTFDAPFGDVQVTTPWGINNKGEIVGGYVDSQGMNYGFYLKAQ